MRTETSRRIAEAASALDCGWSLLSSPDGVTYASGWAVPIETGPSPFAGGPHLALIDSSGNVTLVLPNVDRDEASRSGHENDRIVSFVGVTAQTPEDYAAHYAAAARTALAAVPGRSRIAVEPASLTIVAQRALEARSLVAVDGTHEFARARAIKTPAEIGLLSRSAQAASAAQDAARLALAEGASELDLFHAARAAAEVHAGGRTAFAGDLVSGLGRTSAVGGWPTSRRISSTDPVIADLAPRVAGYWADSCSTLCLEPSTELRRMHAAVREALDAGIAVAVPGTPVGEIDRAIRDVVRRHGWTYPHHTGHGIGASVHEFPRIIPREVEPLRAGMVILLEPGAYEPGVGGVRLEWMFAVEDSGLRPLTDFRLDL